MPRTVQTSTASSGVHLERIAVFPVFDAMFESLDGAGLLVR